MQSAVRKVRTSRYWNFRSSSESLRLSAGSLRLASASLSTTFKISCSPPHTHVQQGLHAGNTCSCGACLAWMIQVRRERTARTSVVFSFLPASSDVLSGFEAFF